MKSRLLPLVFLLLSLLPGWAETRLAVLADNGAQPIADLLITQLSQEKGLVLVERAELEKVLRESNLSAEGNLQQSLTAAHLVHANGVVILESHKTDKTAVIGTRLVACEPGVVIAAGVFGGAPDAAVEAMAKRFKPLWNKLSVAREDAIPVSILNLRCPLKGSEALEAQLTFLLAHQLIQQPALFVLERSRMNDLLMEKEKDEPFWNGSQVIDGQIVSAPDGKLQVSVYLHPPDHSPAQTIEVSGDQEHLATIADALGRDIAAKLVKHPPAPQWKGVEEGAEYLKEAQWSFSAKLDATARSAVEAAWALGCRNPELHRLRLQIYSALAFPPPKRDRTETYGYCRNTIDVSQSDIPLRAAFQALESFRDCVRVSNTGKLEGREVNLGGTALLAASRVLRNYYERGLSNHEDLPELRRKIRETAATLFAYSTEHSQKPYYYDADGHPGYASYPHYEIEAVYLPYWHDTPGEALEAWQACLKRPYQSDSVRGELTHRSLNNTGTSEQHGAPYLVGWHGETYEQRHLLWSGFIKKLSESADPREALDGALLQAYATSESNDRQTAMIRYCERLWEKREAVINGEWGRNYIIFLNRLFPSRWADQQLYRRRWLSFYLQNATSYDSVFLRFGFEHSKSNNTIQDPAVYQQWLAFKDRLQAAGKLTDRIRSSCRDREAESFGPYLQPSPETLAIPTVQVARRWEPEGSDSTLGRHIVWQENLLWVTLGSRNCENAEGTPCYRIRICALSVPAFAVAQTIETPADLAIRTAAPEFFLTPGFLFLKDGNRFHCYDRDKKTWTTIPLPEYPYNRVLARGGELIAGFEGDEKGVVRWSAETQKTEILASSRRRPGTVADEYLVCAKDGFFGGENGKFGVILGYMGRKDGFYWFDPATGKSESPFGYLAAGYKVLSGSNALLISRQCGIAVIANETGAMIQLPGSHFEKDSTRGIQGAPEVQLPEAFNSQPYKELGITKMPALAYGDGHLWTLRPRTEETGRSLLLSRTERLDLPPSSSPDVRLNFASSPIKPVVLQMPPALAFSIAATPEGLVFWITGTNALWWMPCCDFENSIVSKTP